MLPSAVRCQIHRDAQEKECFWSWPFPHAFSIRSDALSSLASSTAAPSTSHAAFGSPLPDSSRCARKRMFLVMAVPSRLLDPGDNFLGNLIGGEILDDARLPLLLWWTRASIAHGVRSRGGGLGALQRRHDRAHIGHADLRIVARLGEIASCPTEQRGSSLAERYLVTAALDAFQDLEGTIGLQGELVDSLELIEDAEVFADQLHGDARTA